MVQRHRLEGADRRLSEPAERVRGGDGDGVLGGGELPLGERSELARPAWRDAHELVEPLGRGVGVLGLDRLLERREAVLRLLVGELGRAGTECLRHPLEGALRGGVVERMRDSLELLVGDVLRARVLERLHGLAAVLDVHDVVGVAVDHVPGDLLGAVSEAAHEAPRVRDRRLDEVRVARADPEREEGARREAVEDRARRVVLLLDLFDEVADGPEVARPPARLGAWSLRANDEGLVEPLHGAHGAHEVRLLLARPVERDDEERAPRLLVAVGDADRVLEALLGVTRLRLGVASERGRREEGEEERKGAHGSPRGRMVAART